MNGFKYDENDPHSIISVKALRVHLRARIPDLQVAMLQKIESYFENDVLQERAIDGT